MQKLKGRLMYTGWLNLPWRLVTDKGEVDLWPTIDKFLTSLNGKSADHKQERDGYTLLANEDSAFTFDYSSGRYAILEKRGGFGLSNVHAYFDDSLIWLSGRIVEIEIEDEKQIRFTADKSEKVHGLYFTDGNLCEVQDGIEKTVCKIGQSECCIFLVAGASGFTCAKFSSLSRAILDRHANGTMRASRIGNCAILGRKERQKTAA